MAKEKELDIDDLKKTLARLKREYQDLYSSYVEAEAENPMVAYAMEPDLNNLRREVARVKAEVRGACPTEEII